MSKVAYEKRREVHPNMGPNERRFVTRTAPPDRGHLKKPDTGEGKMSQVHFADKVGHTPRMTNMVKTEIKESIPQVAITWS